MKPNGLDWPGLMRAGLAQLQLTPDQFWRLTPVELALMLGEPASAKPMGRAALAALQAAWPDLPKEQEDGGR